MIFFFLFKNNIACWGNWASNLEQEPKSQYYFSSFVCPFPADDSDEYYLNLLVPVGGCSKPCGGGVQNWACEGTVKKCRKGTYVLFKGTVLQDFQPHQTDSPGIPYMGITQIYSAIRATIFKSGTASVHSKKFQTCVVTIQ